MTKLFAIISEIFGLLACGAGFHVMREIATQAGRVRSVRQCARPGCYHTEWQ